MGDEQYGHAPKMVLKDRRLVLTDSSHSRKQRAW